MPFEPVGNLIVVRLLVPAPLSRFVPSTVPLSRKVTLPVGVPADDETVAVRTTFLSDTEGFAEELNFVVVGAGNTT